MADADNQWTVKADAKAPRAAVAFFKAKVPLLPADYRALNAKDKQRAFSVAHAVRLDQVNDIAEGIKRAIEKGDSFQTFKRGLKDKLNQAWGENGFALKNVFLTNVMSAYSAGNWRGMNNPAAKAARPLGRYSAVGDDRTCPICSPCDGVTLPLDDPFWQESNPPQHNSCRCEIEALRVDEGAVTDPDDLPDTEAQDGFGIPVDLAAWEPTLADKDQEVAAIYQERIAERDFSTESPVPGWEDALQAVQELEVTPRVSLDDALLTAVRSTRTATILDSKLTDENKQILLNNFAKAEMSKPEFDETLRSIAAGLGGDARTSDLKGITRSLEKITDPKYGGDSTRLRDILRGTIAVGSPSEYTRAIDAVRARFEVLETDRDPKPGNYSDVNMKVRLANGLDAEIQINTPIMLAAKKVAHVPYEEYRKLGKAQREEFSTAREARMAEIVRLMERLYEPAQDINGPMQELIEKHWADVKRAYEGFEGTKGGRVISADDFRQLSPAYVRDPSRAAEVQGAASTATKIYMAEKLAGPTPDGLLRRVTFTAGGPAAGKSTATRTVLGNDPSEFTLDATMSKFDSAVKKFDQVLRADRRVKYVLVDRDGYEAFANPEGGAVARAMKEGRTVPIDAIVAAYRTVNQTARRLYEKYKDDNRVEFTFLANTHGLGKAREIPLASVPDRDYSDLRDRMRAYLEAEFQAGRISKKVRRGFLEKFVDD